MWAIPGLDYIPCYFSPNKQERLLTIIDDNIWTSRANQRAQHYGYAYDFCENLLERCGALPAWIEWIAQRLCDDGFAPDAPNQVTIDECQPGQGIAAHVDSVPFFSETVLAISLGSPCTIQFSSLKGKRHAALLLQPGSLLVMRGEARYDWTHEIEARFQDEIENLLVTRQRRVSLTLRRVVLR